MRGIVLVDLRNIYRPKDMREAGLSYHSIGRECFRATNRADKISPAAPQHLPVRPHST